MIKRPLLRTTTALAAIFAAFALAGCEIFSMPDSDNGSPPDLIGFPSLEFAYLDPENRLTPNDNGTIAMFIRRQIGTPPDILVIADLPGNNSANDLTVRVMNRDWRILSEIRAVYSGGAAVGNNFPRGITITLGAQTIVGSFFQQGAEEFTVTFKNTSGTQQAQFENLSINPNVFNVHQNIRLCRMVTTLAILNSLRLQITHEHLASQSISFDWGWDIFSGALNNTAVTTPFQVLTASLPEASVTQGNAINVSPRAISLLATAHSTAASPSVAVDLARPPPPAPLPSSGTLPNVTITKGNGTAVINNSSFLYLPFEQQVTFNINAESIIDIFLFDPTTSEIVHPNALSNALFFTYQKQNSEDGSINLTITRSRLGSVDYGKIQFLIWFNQAVEINSVSNSGYIWVGHNHATWRGELRQHNEQGNIFVLNFTVLPPAQGGTP